MYLIDLSSESPNMVTEFIEAPSKKGYALGDWVIVTLTKMCTSKPES